ncbi:hypothetical protein [Aquimarina pacifica]|uniref:hypothetical protein n=1 Tax=Aquimarina pacifica TaxID=1296415 RepID=UPI0012686FAC|nr:hypothetical protein [Aquimarina pacifica]
MNNSIDMGAQKEMDTSVRILRRILDIIYYFRYSFNRKYVNMPFVVELSCFWRQKRILEF